WVLFSISIRQIFRTYETGDLLLNVLLLLASSVLMVIGYLFILVVMRRHAHSRRASTSQRSSHGARHLQRGARSILGTRWRVSDHAVLDLCRRLYFFVGRTNARVPHVHHRGWFITDRTWLGVGSCVFRGHAIDDRGVALA